MSYKMIHKKFREWIRGWLSGMVGWWDREWMLSVMWTIK